MLRLNMFPEIGSIVRYALLILCFITNVIHTILGFELHMNKNCKEF